MSDAAPDDPSESMFDQLLDHLDEAQDLCTRPDRSERRARIIELCGLAAGLAATAQGERK